MASIRSQGVPGLIFTPGLMAKNVSIEATFEPSLGIMARRVNRLGLNIRSFREPLQRAVREVVIPSIDMNFRKEGRPTRWQPLVESTIAQRQGNGFDLRILQRTGELRKAMKRQNIWHIDTEKAFIANLPSKVWYGAIHQKGNDSFTRSAGKDVSSEGAFNVTDPVTGLVQNLGEHGAIPARPFVLLQKSEEEMIDEVFLDWLDERALAAGFRTSARSMILSGDF